MTHRCPPGSGERRLGFPLAPPALRDANYRSANLILAATTNPFWAALVDVIDEDAPEHAATVAEVYGSRDGRVDLAPFFDLLAVHELTHVFLEHRRAHLPRLWLTELTCNLALHNYVASEEPSLLPVLETFPAALAACHPSRFRYRSLADFEARYAFGMEPLNYGWYQCRLHVGARRIHESAGAGALRRLWDTFGAAPRAVPDDLSDEQLATLLDEAVDPAVGEIIRSW